VDKALVPLRVPWNSAVRSALTDELRSVRPDVVHVHNTFPLLSPSVVAACTDAGVPVVATLHNYSMICPPGTLYRDGRICTSCVGRLPVPAVQHGCYRDSSLATVPVALNLTVNRRRWWSDVSRFFCISAAQRQLLIQGGMPASRLSVKHNFVPDPGVSSAAREHVLYLGRLTEEKGVRLLMAAWERASVGLPLVIAGTGPMEDEVSRWAAERSDVRYVGLQDAAGCRSLTASAAAVVVPSTWLEAFGLVVVEAMAAGVPTVAAAHGAFVELVDDGVTGVLHRPGDVSSLASAMATAVTLPGEAARARYERDFTPEVGLARLEEGYRAAIAGTLVESV
jgi:glycosyltransferase involved in cell wall biosynthesis